MKRSLLRSLAAFACLGLFSPPWTFAVSKPDQPDKPNFSGTWTLDLKGSTSFEPLMKQIGAGFLERKYAASVTLKATLQQTELVMTIAARGPGFAVEALQQITTQDACGWFWHCGYLSQKPGKERVDAVPA